MDGAIETTPTLRETTKTDIIDAVTRFLDYLKDDNINLVSIQDGGYNFRFAVGESFDNPLYATKVKTGDIAASLHFELTLVDKIVKEKYDAIRRENDQRFAYTARTSVGDQKTDESD